METQIGTDLDEAVRLLNQGELVAIPTETVYGLAGNALNPAAVLSIFETKERPTFDPLIVHVSSIDALADFVREVPDTAKKLAAHFWPGPLTLLLPKSSIIPDVVTSGLETVAVRIPAHPTALDLLRRLDFPLAAPSANLFGKISPTKAEHVKEQLVGRIRYVLDGGACTIGLESTIIGFADSDESPTIYRLGGIPVEAIEQVVGRVRIRPHSTSNPLAPGMLKSHYAPQKPLYLGADYYPENASFLRFSHYLPEIPTHRQLILSEKGELGEAAVHLFAYLRKLDRMDTQMIIAELLPEKGLGRAINDRLRRAAAKEKE